MTLSTHIWLERISDDDSHFLIIHILFLLFFCHPICNPIFKENVFISSVYTVLCTANTHLDKIIGTLNYNLAFSICMNSDYSNSGLVTFNGLFCSSVLNLFLFTLIITLSRNKHFSVCIFCQGNILLVLQSSPFRYSSDLILTDSLNFCCGTCLAKSKRPPVREMFLHHEESRD